MQLAAAAAASFFALLLLLLFNAFAAISIMNAPSGRCCRRLERLKMKFACKKSRGKHKQ
jgi:hypothetical protein